MDGRDAVYEFADCAQGDFWGDGAAEGGAVVL